jgi:hypothetical protein
VLAGGPLGTWPTALLPRSRLAGVFAGRLALLGAVGGALLAVDALDGRADPLPVGPLGGVVGLGAEGPVRIGDVVAVPVVLDLGGGLPPGPLAPGRLGHRAQGLQDIAGALLLDG